ncbi:MAG: hypothetical protein M3Z22_08290, partial [Verrucomicrobiota bacterium]|nr:hypothetical protein [Verrucomicrobiota bacterium]
WDEAIAAQRRAVELDPRSIQSASILATSYMITRHFADALALADRILVIEPTAERGIKIKARCLRATGNVDAVEPLLANPGADSETRAVQALIKRRYPEAVDILSKVLSGSADYGNRDVLLLLALAQHRAGDTAAARTAYEQAAQEIKRELEKVAPDSGPAAGLHSDLGVAYAGLGEAASAVAEGQKGMAMQPTSQDPLEGPLREEAMAQIYTLLGDADHAIPILARLVKIFALIDITPTFLRIDPTWDPIRNDPRFQKLAAGEDGP